MKSKVCLDSISESNVDFPNLRDVVETALRLFQKFEENNLIEKIFVERLEMIHQVWTKIDNELNKRERQTESTMKRFELVEKIKWNFLVELEKYEKTFFN